MTRYDPFVYGEVRLDANQKKSSGGAPPDSDDLLFADTEAVKQAPPADASWSLLDEDVDGLLPGAAPDSEEAVAFGADILGEGAPNEMSFEELFSATASAENSQAGDGENNLSDLDDASPGMQPQPDMMGDEVPAGTVDYLAEQPAPELDVFDESPAMQQPSVADAMPAVAAPMPSPEVRSTDPAAPPRKRREVRRRRIEVPEPQVDDTPVLPATARARAKAKAKAKTKTKANANARMGRRRMPALAALAPLLLCVVGGTAASWFWVMQANPVMAGILGAGTLVSALFSWLFLRG